MTKKSRKQDRKLVAAKQEGEVNFIYNKYKIPKFIIREVVKEYGHSRYKQVYPRLRELGYEVGK